jgi:hypothetical protein
MDITPAISVGKAAFSLAKTLQDGIAKQRIKPEEVPSRLIELQQYILNLQEYVHELAEENHQLSTDVERLQLQNDLSASLEFAEEAYWRRKPDKRLDGPFCPFCWDDTRKLIHLKLENLGRVMTRDDGSTARRYDCVIHKTIHFIPDRIFAPPDVIS